MYRYAALSNYSSAPFVFVVLLLCAALLLVLPPPRTSGPHSTRRLQRSTGSLRPTNSNPSVAGTPLAHEAGLTCMY